MVIAYVEIPEAFTDLVIAVPLHLLQGMDRFRFELTPDHADQVFDGNGQLIDPRRLSIRLKSLMMQTVRQRTLPVFAAGEQWSCGEAQPGSLALASHFHMPEERFAWIAGKSGRIWFRLSSVPDNPELRLRLRGRVSLATGEMPRVTLTANGDSLGTHLLVVFDDEGELTVDISKVDLSARLIDLVIETSHAEAVYDSLHQITDNRLLGLGVISFGVFSRAAAGADADILGDGDDAPDFDAGTQDSYARTT
jgi:hypothetical protein